MSVSLNSCKISSMVLPGFPMEMLGSVMLPQSFVTCTPFRILSPLILERGKF